MEAQLPCPTLPSSVEAPYYFGDLTPSIRKVPFSMLLLFFFSKRPLRQT